MKNVKKIIAASLTWLVFLPMVNAQTADWKKDRKVNILFGLNQALIVNGFNAEVNYIHDRLIFDYSHGTSLDFNKSLVSDELKTQGIVVHLPYSSGFGVGYRIQKWINLRIEPKWHRFEFYYDGESQNDKNRIATETNFSLGMGLYTHFQPFANKAGFLKGLMIAPSVRFWPTVSSSFDDDKFSYTNSKMGKTQEIESVASGIGLTPLIINVSIGYSFDVRKKH